MRPFGSLERCFVLYSEHTGHSKGYGFAEYMMNGSAARARLIYRAPKHCMCIAQMLGRCLLPCCTPGASVWTICHLASMMWMPCARHCPRSICPPSFTCHVARVGS